MNKQVRDLTINAALCAVIAILTFLPIGYIPLGFTSVTVIHVVVIIGAILLGPRHGFALGLFFGVSSLIRSQTTGLTGDTTFMWPWVSVLPRALFGLLTGLIYALFKKVIKNKSIAISVTAFLSTVVHTVLVFIMYFPTFCFMQGFNPFESFSGNGIWGISVTQPLLLYCFLVFMSSCLLESILAVIVSTPICRSLEQYILDPSVAVEDEDEVEK